HQKEETDRERRDAVAARDLARRKAAEADASARLADEQRALALAAVGDMVTEVQTHLADVPSSQEVRRKLLATALARLRGMARKAADSSAVERRMAAAYMNMGDLFPQLGQAGEALAEYRRCYRLLAQQAAADPSDDKAKGNVAAACIKLGLATRDRA